MPDRRIGVVTGVRGRALALLLALGATLALAPLAAAQTADPGTGTSTTTEPEATGQPTTEADDEPAEGPGPPESDDDPAWSSSTFDAPEDPVTELRAGTLAVAGTFRYRKPRATAEILRATVVVVDDDRDDFEPNERCELPGPVEVASDGTSAAETVDELAFGIDDLAFPCNGRFVIEATAESTEGEAFTLRTGVVVEILPAGISRLAVTVDRAAQTATVEWEPVRDDELPADAIGYLVERAGPPSEDGAWGHFAAVRTVGVAAEPRVVDEVVPGDYRYRVRTLRNGPNGLVRSSIADTTNQTVTVEEPPPSTTTTAAPTTRPPRVGRAIPTLPRRPAPSFSPPTTADTGFDEELDYGEQPTTVVTEQVTVPELASENPVGGQSIVRDEGEGVNLLVPGAAALVLLGWAGHIVYLNRLAKQL